MSKISSFSCDNEDIIGKPYNNDNDDNNNNNKPRYCVSRLLGCLLLLIIIIGGVVVSGIFIHKGINDDKARNAPFTFQVDFLEVTSMTFSRPNNSITSNQYFNLTVNTKLAQLFRPLQVTIEYDHHLLSNTTIAPFRQQSLSMKTIPVQIMGTADTRLPDKVIESISTKLESEGVLDFTVIVRGDNWDIDYRGRAETCDMKMVCKGVRVTLSSTNNTWNGSTKDDPFLCRYSSKDCDYY